MSKSFKILSVKCSFLLAATLLVSGCPFGGKDGPKIELCISVPELGGFKCRPKDEGEPYVIPYDKTADYVATNLEDFELLLNYCKNRGRKSEISDEL